MSIYSSDRSLNLTAHKFPVKGNEGEGIEQEFLSKTQVPG